MLREIKIQVAGEDSISIAFDGEGCKIKGTATMYVDKGTRFFQILAPEMKMPITITTQIPMSKDMLMWHNGYVVEPKYLILESPKEVDRVWGKWACSKGFDPNNCQIQKEENRSACVYVPEVGITVDSDLTDKRIDRCQFLVKMSEVLTG